MHKEFDLYNIREVINKISYQPFDSTKAAQVVQRLIKPTQKAEIDLIRRRSPGIIRQLEEVVTRLEVPKTEIDPAALSASFALDVASDTFTSNTIRAQRIKKPDLFILFFDTDLGATMAALPILEVTQPGMTKNLPNFATIVADSAESREQFLGTGISASSQATVYIKLQDQIRRWTLLFHEVTSTKPEGFILIEERVKQLKNLPNRLGPNNLPGHFVPQFVAAGADFTKAIFRAIYPVSKQFIASK